MATVGVRATVKLELRWNAEDKCWRIYAQAFQGRRVVSAHGIDAWCQEPMDSINVLRLCAAMVTEMESWLPMYGQPLE